MTINKDDLIKMRHLAVEKFGAHFRWGQEVTPAWGGGMEHLRFRLTPEEIQRVMQDMQGDTEAECGETAGLNEENRESKRGRVKTYKRKDDRLFRCGAGRTEVVIGPYGEMRLCLDIPEPKYDILEGNFAEGWRRLADYAKNTPPGPSYQCGTCDLAAYCNWCPARAWLACGDMSACPPYYRQAAGLAKREFEKSDRNDHQPLTSKSENEVLHVES
jgi:radical SAM protein with 4Fe4S-binding SPASM domain